MSLVAESENHFLLLWPAHLLMVGDYSFNLTLEDDHGAKSIANMHLKVLKNDHAPKLLKVVPEDSLIYGMYGEVILFELQAIDPDGDSLSYCWMIDDQIVSSETQAFMNLTLGNELPGHFYLKGRVMADEKSISRIWFIQTSPTQVDEKKALPEYALFQNYPNPFNPTTVIGFMIPRTGGYASLDIYNSTGQKVRSLVNHNVNAGEHYYVWDGRDDQGNLLPTGVYTYHLSVAGFEKNKKLIYIK